MKPSDDPLTPLSFLERSYSIFPNKTATVDAETGLSFDYSRFAERVCSLASSLRKHGVKGERIAFLSLNSTALLEAHFAVPLANRVLVAINFRLTPKEILYIVRHSGSKSLFYDSRLSKQIEDIREKLQQIKSFKLVRIGARDEVDSEESYEELVSTQQKTDLLSKFRLDSEKSMIAIDYTSGTTGVPKGVMYSHRGAYLNASADIIHTGLNSDSSYLWTLPMFHCNGWCFTWATIGAGARNVIMSRLEPERIWNVIQDHSVTHLCAAPTVLVNMASVSDSFKRSIDLKKKLTILTGGAPPAPKVIENIEDLGTEVIHLYGLTETYGPNMLCLWNSSWNGLEKDMRSKIKARQGVRHVNAGKILVADDKMKEVGHDGKTVGEIVMRGNTIMLGYYKDPKATRAAFRGGMFHSGDLAVVHEDGYAEIVDRKKDLIISGGEKISSVEVESVLYRHPSVLEAAVIAVPDSFWGEVPKAFVSVRDGLTISESDLLDFCRHNLAHFKCPKYFEFGPLPRTSTGKVMKFVLREKEWANQSKRIH